MSQKVEVKGSRIGGRGVFATRNIRVGEIFEVCPVVPLTPSEFDSISETKLQNYVYSWPGPRQDGSQPMDKWSGAAIVLGYAMLYNHSHDPNSEWSWSISRRTLTFRAIKPIKRGEEIFHCYHWPDWMYEDVGIPPANKKKTAC